ncbi:disease resistance protein (NBS-LRR class) family protein [Medicago truncatula]|uniref:Disease resistance protein (NBS-LRR class) family protein n=1 Tax=Medicago truncatula TaxID=3880 RepID=A0A072UJH6_MEDTR|nr:disease resistance protein (NBS-LRR class) family protein [Medicago truncatula]
MSSGAPNLEELSFGNCKNLIKIHESVGFLNKLKMLNADGCSRLGTFPSLKLSSLEKLKLSSCYRLKSFPEILGKMEDITMLDLLDTPIKELPFTIHNLTQVERVVLISCGTVPLPSSIFVMPELHELIAGECTLLLPKSVDFEAQSSSMVLNLGLSGCNVSDEFLRIGLPLFSNVKELYLSQNKFTTLPACVKEFYFLTKIHLDVCKNLKRIRGVPPNMETLSAKWCTSLIVLDLKRPPKCVEVCRFLKTLILDNFINLEEVRGVPPNMRTLSARN